jgi:hypothetical protein
MGQMSDILSKLAIDSCRDLIGPNTVTQLLYDILDLPCRGRREVGAHQGLGGILGQLLVYDPNRVFMSGDIRATLQQHWAEEPPIDGYTNESWGISCLYHERLNKIQKTQRRDTTRQ